MPMPSSPVTHLPSPPRRSGSARPRPLVPLAPLLAVLTLALGLAGLLIPRQGELVSRLVKDGRHDRALALVGESVGGGQASDSPPTPANLVTVLLDSADQHFDEAAIQRIDALVRITDDPAGVRKVLFDRRRILPHGLLPTLLDHLATRAVHLGNPALAVSLFGDLETLQGLDLDQTGRCVAACRFAGQPRAALDVISRYLEANRLPFTQLPEDLRMTTIALHREVNEGSKAFDLLSEEFKATLDPAQRHELVELLTTVAAQSDRLPDSLPLLQDYLASTDAGRKDWTELLGRNPSSPSDADFLRFGKILARHLEWNNRTSESFDLYRRLAAMGDLESLDRCLTIYPWVDRQDDAADLLEALAPVKGREAYTLLLARLQAERGRFREAETIYRAELAGAHAGDATVWAELGGILDAQDRFDETLAAYRRALDLSPERHDIRIRLARLHVTLGNHAAALLAYRKLPAEAHDRKTREDFAMIAKSLDSPRDFIHAVQLKLDAESVADPGHYLDIADAWDSLAEPGSVETSLREGLKRFPGNAPLTLRLADHLSVAGRPEEAFELLTRSQKLADKRFSSRILSLGIDLGRPEETIRLVAKLPEDWSPSERIDLANLHEELGDVEGALAQYRLAGEADVEIARIEAEQRHHRGDHAGAAEAQARYLSLLREPDAEGWTFLGDLYHLLNRAPEAEAAYQKALEHLKLQLAREPSGDSAKPEVAVTR